MMMMAALFGDAGRKNSRGVEDAPFVATLMQVTGSGRDQVLRFETNVHDFATAGAEHALRIELAQRQTPSPIFTFARA